MSRLVTIQSFRYPKYVTVGKMIKGSNNFELIMTEDVDKNNSVWIMTDPNEAGLSNFKNIVQDEVGNKEVFLARSRDTIQVDGKICYFSIGMTGGDGIDENLKIKLFSKLIYSISFSSEKTYNMTVAKIYNHDILFVRNDSDQPVESNESLFVIEDYIAPM